MSECVVVSLCERRSGCRKAERFAEVRNVKRKFVIVTHVAAATTGPGVVTYTIDTFFSIAKRYVPGRTESLRHRDRFKGPCQ